MAEARVYLGNLSYETTERDVEKFLKGYGRIRTVNMKVKMMCLDFPQSGFLTPIFRKAMDLPSSRTSATLRTRCWTWMVGHPWLRQAILLFVRQDDRREEGEGGAHQGEPGGEVGECLSPGTINDCSGEEEGSTATGTMGEGGLRVLGLDTGGFRKMCKENYDIK